MHTGRNGHKQEYFYTRRKDEKDKLYARMFSVCVGNEIPTHPGSMYAFSTHESIEESAAICIFYTSSFNLIYIVPLVGPSFFHSPCVVLPLLFTLHLVGRDYGAKWGHISALH